MVDAMELRRTLRQAQGRLWGTRFREIPYRWSSFRFLCSGGTDIREGCAAALEKE
jgi:hypothetical protein